MATSLSKPRKASERIFLAIELPIAIKSEIACLHERLSSMEGHLKLVAPDLIHITVRFLGELSSEELDLAHKAGSATTADALLFSLSLGHVGAFPARNRVPRVIWVGLRHDDGYALLHRLAARLEDELVARGFSREARVYAPHLTVARVRDDLPKREGDRLGEIVDALSEAYSFTGRFEVKSLTVMRSELTPNGPRYTPLVVLPFKGQRDLVASDRDRTLA